MCFGRLSGIQQQCSQYLKATAINSFCDVPVVKSLASLRIHLGRSLAFLKGSLILALRSAFNRLEKKPPLFVMHLQIFSNKLIFI